MWHTKRRWSVSSIDTAEELADKVVNRCWCGCTGFSLGGYLFLNDQTCADGAGEYGVVKADDVTRQVESITFSWCSQAEALAYIQQALSGAFDVNAWNSGITPEQIIAPEGHRCSLCT
jgi:hypothetical protein